MTTMASSSSFLFLSLLLSFSLLPISISIHSVNGGFSIELIHRDHPTKSPYFDSSLSPSDRLRSAFRRSISRFNHLFQTKEYDFNSKVISNQFEYLMTLQIGTPPLKILAIADTGSDLTWTQCEPCIGCDSQKSPIFNTKNSSSYKTVSCSTDSCYQLPSGSCTNESLCEYQNSYGDGSTTNGILSSDTFTFSSDGENGATTFQNVTFGCSRESNDFDQKGSGLAGLGGGSLSLVSQFSSSIDHKFSYCLVPHSNINATSLLNFGDNAIVGGIDVVTTPLLEGRPETVYYLSLEAINVGSETVAVSRKVGQQEGEGEVNIIIDSGTTLTLLPDSVLDPVKEQVLAAVKYPIVQDPTDTLDPCFDTSSVTGSTLELPELTFVFRGNAKVDLRAYNSFVSPKEGVICFAFTSNSNLGLSIYGNIAQQNFHIGYDLWDKKLRIAPADCANL